KSVATQKTDMPVATQLDAFSFAISEHAALFGNTPLPAGLEVDPQVLVERELERLDRMKEHFSSRQF
ncbi:MAG: hypothetical protein AAF329_27515, partial [Cyanobacteria bacterium P01_A01_bin.17]